MDSHLIGQVIKRVILAQMAVENILHGSGN